MEQPLKILILEDSPSDAEMVIRLLRREWPDVDHQAVMTEEDYVRALHEYQPDVIVSDNSLPQFNAQEALRLLRAGNRHIPFILVTGTVSEEFAAGIIKQGADDYILKDRLTRLPSAIENALRQRREAAEKQEVANRLRISEENLSAIFQNASEGFILTDMEYHVKTFNNNAEQYVLANTGVELHEGIDLFDLLQADRKVVVSAALERVSGGEKVEYDRQYIKVDTQPAWFHFCITPVWKEEQVGGVCITLRDITEQKKSEKMRHEMEQEVFKQRVQAQKEVARAIIKAQEGERNRIGQELHDNVNQILAGTKMFLGNAGKDERLRELLDYPMELLDKCMQEIRALSHKHVTPLKDIDLQQLVQSLLHDLEKNTQISTEFVYKVDHAMGDELNLNIYRIIQEQFNNIVKHAQASKVSVVIEGSQVSVCISVTDNGKGFDLNQQRRGIGIANTINRIGLFNGHVAIDTAPGQGTCLRITIPLDQE